MTPTIHRSWWRRAAGAARPPGRRALLAASAAVPPLVLPGAASAAVEDGARAAPAIEAPAPAAAPAQAATPLAILLAQATLLSGQHQDARALDSLHRALLLAPDDADALALTVRVAAEAGSAAEAEAALARLRAAHPGDPRLAALSAELRAGPPKASALAAARAAARSGKLVDAVARYRDSFGGDRPPPGLATEYYETLGGTSGGYDEARDGLRRAIDADPRDAAAQLAYARLLSYRELSREDGIARLTTLTKDPATAEAAGKSLRQALLWLPDQPDSVKLLAPYAALHPEDAEVAQKLEAARHPPQAVLDPQGQARNAAFDALKGRRFVDAERDFKKALSLNDADADATAGLGLVRLRQGRLAEGRELLERALTLGPSEKAGIEAALRGTAGRPASGKTQAKPEAAPGLAEASRLARAGDLRGAEAAYRRALAERPGSSAAAVGLAGVLLRQGRGAEADALYARVGDAAGRRAVGRARAERLREEARGVSDPVAKAGLYRSAVAADPANPWLRLELARALAAQGRPDDARSVMAGVGDGADPDGVEAAFYFALDGGELERAAALAARLPAARRTPSIVAVQERVAVQAEIARAARGGPAEARAALLALASRPDPTGARVVEIAAALLKAGDVDGARDAVAVAVAARPPSADQRLAYAGALVAAGDADGAAALAKGIDEARLPAGGRGSLDRLRDGIAAAGADALARDGRLDEAFERLAPRLAANPDGRELNLALARLYARRGDAVRAVAITGALLARDPADLDLRRAAVDALVDAGDLDRAAEVAAEGVRLAPRDPRAYLASAAVAKARDEGARALADLRTARSLRPPPPPPAPDLDDGPEPARGAVPVRIGANPFRPGPAGGGAPPPTPGVLGDLYEDLPSEALARSIDRDIAELHDRVVPAVQTGLAFLGRSGQDGLSRLAVVSAPVEGSAAPAGVGLLRVSATPTLADGGAAKGGSAGGLSQFGTEPLRAAAGLASGGAQRALGTALGASYAYRFATADIGTTPLGFREASVVGGVELVPRVGPDLALRLTGDRRAIVNSVLSYAGARDPATGRGWGGVVADRGMAQLEWAPGRWFLYGGAGGGVVTGHHVGDNPFLQAQLGASYGVLSDDVRELRVGLALPYFDYAHNENFFTYGHGGYFSPQNYVAAQVPVSWRERLTDRLSYKVEGSLGVQSFTQRGAAVFPQDPALQAQLDGTAGALRSFPGQSTFGPAGGVAAEVEYRVDDALRLDARAAFQKAGDYTEGSAQVSARYSFDEDRR